jgi:hypothetical protein
MLPPFHYGSTNRPVRVSKRGFPKLSKSVAYFSRPRKGPQTGAGVTLRAGSDQGQQREPSTHLSRSRLWVHGLVLQPFEQRDEGGVQGVRADLSSRNKPSMVNMVMPCICAQQAAAPPIADIRRSRGMTTPPSEFGYGSN